MSVTFLDNILEEINSQIDPMQLIEKISYFPEKAQQVGPSLKAFCPLHGEKVFRSLIIDTTKKTYKCSLKTCSGFQGGTLIDFYAKLKDQTYLKAAFSIAEELGITIDVETITKLSEGFHEEAKKYYSIDNFREAEKCCLQALDIEPANIEARFLLALIYEKDKRVSAAFDEFLKVINGYVNVERYDEALTILKHSLLAKDPKNVEFLFKSAEICEKTGKKNDCIENLLTIASVNEETGELDQNIEIFRRILGLDENRIDVREKLASIYEKAADIQAAVSEYMYLAELAKKRNDVPRAIHFLSHIKELDSSHFQARHLLIEMLDEHGSDDESENEILSFAKILADNNEYDEAQKCYERLINRNPMSISGYQGLANLFLKQDRRGDAAAIYSKLSDIFSEKNLLTEALQAAEEARRCNDEQPVYYEKIAELHNKSGNENAAIEEYFHLGEFYLDRDMNDEAVKVLSRISQRFPDDVERRLRVGKILETSHMTDNALHEYSHLAKNLKQTSRYDELEKVCQRGIFISPENIPLNEWLLESFLERELRPQAIEQYKKLFELYKKNNDEKASVKLLSEAIEFEPSEIYFNYELSRIFIAKDKKKESLIILKKLSQLYKGEGKTNELAENCKVIIGFENDNLESHLTLAEIYRESGKSENAISEYDAISDIYSAKKDLNNAIISLNKILELDEQNLPALRKIAEIIIRSQGFNNARKYVLKRLDIMKEICSSDEVCSEFDWILQNSPDDLELKRKYAEYLVDNNFSDKAISIYESLRVMYADKKKDYEAAAEICTKLIEIRPEYYAYHLLIGNYYIQISRKNDAIYHLRLASEGFESIGDIEQAIEPLTKILELDSSRNDIRLRKSQLLEQIGKTTDAINEYLDLTIELEKIDDSENLRIIYSKILELDKNILDIRLKLAQLLEKKNMLPEATEQYLILSSLYARTKNIDNAIAICLHLKKIVPDNVRVREELIMFYIDKKENSKLQTEFSEVSELCIRQKDFDKGAKYLNELKKLSPNDASVLERTASLHEGLGNIDKACEEYQSLGDVYYSSGEIDKAVSSYEKIRNLKPDMLYLREKLADYYIEAGKPELAIREFLALAGVYYNNKENKKAISSCKKAAELSPFNTSVRIEILSLFREFNGDDKSILEFIKVIDEFLSAREFEKSLEIIRKAQEFNPENTLLREKKIIALESAGNIPEIVREHFEIAHLYYNLAEIEPAEKHYRKILEYDPANIESYYQIVECCLITDRKDEAMNSLDIIAELHHQLGDIDSGIASLKRCLSINQNRFESRLNLARYYEENQQISESIAEYNLVADNYISNKDYENAEELYRRVILLDPIQIDTQRKLIFLLNVFKGIDAARERYKDYLEICHQYLPYEKLDQIFENLISIDDGNASLHFQYAEYLKNRNINDSAINEYLKASEIYENSGDPNSSINALREVEKLDPENVNLLVRIALANKEIGDENNSLFYYLKAAKKFTDSSNYKKAIESYIAALSINSHNEQALIEIAAIYEKINQKTDAIESYLRIAEIRLADKRDNENVEILLKVLNLDPLLTPIRERLAQIYESLNLNEDAFYHYMLLGEALEKQNEDEHAVRIYQHLKTIHEDARQNRERLIQIYLKDKKMKEAKKELKDLAELLLSQQLIEDAELILSKIKDLYPDDYANIELLGQLYEKKGDILAACREYTRVADIYESQNDIKSTIGALERVRNLDNVDTSIRERLLDLRLRLKDISGALEEGLNLLSIYFQSGGEPEALQLADKMDRIDSLNINVRKSIAKIMAQYGLMDRCMMEYEGLSMALLEDEKYSDAVAVLSEGIETTPDSISLHKLKVRAYIGLDEIPNAVATLKTLAQLFSAIGQNDDEEKIYKEILRIEPDDIDTHRGLISIYKNNGDINKANQHLHNLSMIHQKSGNIKDAVLCHEEILSIDPDRNDVRDELSDLLIKDKRIDAAVEHLFILSETLSNSGDYNKSREYLIRILQIHPESTKALHMIISVSEQLKDKPGIIKYSIHLAEIFEALKATTDALNIYNKIIKIDPENFEIYKKTAALYEDIGDTNNLVQIYTLISEKYQTRGALGESEKCLIRISELDPDNIVNLQNLARLNLKTRNSAGALNNFQKTAALLKSMGNFRDIIGIAEEMVAIDENRTESYEILAEAYSETGEKLKAIAQYDILAGLYETKDDLDNAVIVLNKILLIAPDKTEDRERFAQLLYKTGDNLEAIDQYFQLANTYRDKGEYPEAVSCCKKALTIDSENMNIRKILCELFIDQTDYERAIEELEFIVEYYIANGEFDDAERWLNKGLDLPIENLALREIAVKFHISINNIEEATEQYLKITAAAINSQNFAKAIEALEGAKKLVPDNIEIRRSLAELYMRTNQKEKSQEELLSVIDLYLIHGLIEESRDISNQLIKMDSMNITLRERIAENYETHTIPEVAAKEYVEIAKICKTRQDIKKVQEYVSKVLELKPNNIEAREILAESLESKKDTKAIYSVYDQLSDLYLEKMYFDKAIVILNKMKVIDPEDLSVREKLVSVYSKSQRTDEEYTELYDLAVIYADQSKLEEAVNAFKTLLSYRPDDTQVRVKYIDAYSQIGSEIELISDYMMLIDSFIRHGAVVEATKTFEKVLKIDPKNTQSREKFIEFLLKNVQNTRALEEIFQLADVYNEQGSFKNAIKVLNDGAKISPEDYEVHLKLSEAYKKMNARGMALNELKIVAKLYQQKNIGKQSIEIYQKIVEIDPQNLDVLRDLIDLCIKYDKRDLGADYAMQLADVYISRGLLDLAEKEYRRVTKLTPENITAWNYLIETYLQIGLEEDLVEEYATLGDVYLSQGNLKDSLKSYRKVLEINPEHIDARKKYIDTYMQIGMENELIEDYLILADSLIKRNEIDEAVGYYNHILALDPGNEVAKNKLTETQTKLRTMFKKPESKPKSETSAPVISQPSAAPKDSRLAEALDNFENVLKLNPANANAHCKVADVLEQMGRIEDAISHLDKASEIFFTKGEMKKCISICNRILEKNPNDAKIRDRLSKAELRKDAFKALESAILASDTGNNEDEVQDKKAKAKKDSKSDTMQ